VSENIQIVKQRGDWAPTGYSNVSGDSHARRSSLSKLRSEHTPVWKVLGAHPALVARFQTVAPHSIMIPQIMLLEKDLIEAFKRLMFLQPHYEKTFRLDFPKSFSCYTCYIVIVICGRPHTPY